MRHMSATPRVRMSPARRREQLLDLGVTLLATRSLDELSIETLAEEAGISRGLLYHYFSDKRDFHLAVLRRMSEEGVAHGPADHPYLLARSIEGSKQGFERLCRSLAER